MNERDGQRIRQRTRRLSSEFYGAGIGLVDTRQNLDQRGFAGAILAEQRVNLAATDIKVDMIESKRRGEALDEAAHNEERRGPAVRTGSFDALHDRSSVRGSIRRIADCKSEVPGGLAPPGRGGYLTPQISR